MFIPKLSNKKENLCDEIAMKIKRRKQGLRNRNIRILITENRLGLLFLSRCLFFSIHLISTLSKPIWPGNFGSRRI